jgi:uncharacterized protein
MPDSGFIAVFLVGLLGGVHCVGMCGGIVSALSLNVPARGGAIPLASSVHKTPASPAWSIHLAYNAGRIASYCVAGAVMGAVGSLGLLLNTLLPVQMGLYIAANVMMIALGLYLVGQAQVLMPLEKLGQKIWRRVQPFTRRFLPVRGPLHALPLGMLWGWLPCGMVYSVLSLALLTGSAGRGAMTLLVFGLGTLPNLLLAGLLLARYRSVVQHPRVRLASGLLVAGFGLWGLLNAQSLGGRLWSGVVCLT